MVLILKSVSISKFLASPKRLSNFNANTLCAYNGQWWHVQGGKVNFNSNNTFCAYNGKWFYIKNGAADFTKNGKVYYYGKYYTVKNGIVV